MTEPGCFTCGATYKDRASFCSSCGQRRAVAPVGSPTDVRTVIWFFIALFAVLLPASIYVIHFDGDPFCADVVASTGLACVTLAFAIARRSLWWPLYKTFGFRWNLYLAIAVAAPVVLVLVYAYTSLLSYTFGIHVPNELEAFRDHHILWAIGLLAILPPLIEELAFRGIMYTGLRETLGVAEAVIISSFAFGLLHLSIPALVTHVPLGIYFCYLRQRSGRLWPSMLAHALHNAGVILVESLA